MWKLVLATVALTALSKAAGANLQPRGAPASTLDAVDTDVPPTALRGSADDLTTLKGAIMQRMIPAEANPAVDTEVTSLVSTLNSTGLWPDVDYFDDSRSVSKSPQNGAVCSTCFHPLQTLSGCVRR